MSKESECKKLRAELKEMQRKLDKLEEPELDYQEELDAFLGCGFKVITVECGGAVRLKGIGTGISIKITKDGVFSIDDAYGGVPVDMLRSLYNLCRAVKNSHGC